LQAVTEQDDAAAVKAVGNVAGRNEEKQSGQEQRQASVAQVERGG
jgi:hypothetical protein